MKQIQVRLVRLERERREKKREKVKKGVEGAAETKSDPDVFAS